MVTIMNETIGEKGGANDRRRSLKITKQKYQKLKQIGQLEKKYRINQIKQATILIPLVIAGAIIKDITTTESTKDKYQKSSPEKLPSKESNKVVETIEQNSIFLKETNIEKSFENLKNFQIIDYYEHKLKEIKLDLKNINYEYNVLKDNKEELYESKVAENLLNKLNIIITKLEQLKQLIDISDTKEFDQNYISNLIDNYLDDFSNQNIVDEIKDSPLYILISFKISELITKKELLLESLTKKKEQLNLDEQKLDQFKEQYNRFDNFNNELLKFQINQDSITKDIENKVANAVSYQEKVEIKMQFLNKQINIIRDIITPQLLIPGTKSGIRIAVATASLVYILRNHLKPKKKIKRHKVIDVKDYTKDITDSINDIDKGLHLLKKSKNELEKIIDEFYQNYKQYFGRIKECDLLFDNLNNIFNSLKEKEDELEILKIKQEKNLENNNVKVNTLKYE